jgi:hypothetical protein
MMKESTKRKLSEIMKEKYKDPAYKAKITEKNRERAASVDWRKKRSETQKKLWQDPAYRQHMSEAHKGKTISKEQREKMAIGIRRRYKEDPSFREKISQASKKTWQNPQYREKILRKLLGEKYEHLGIKPHYTKKIKQSLPYRRWREQVYERDDFTCQLCGQRGGKLEPHHIYEFSLYPDKRFDVKNGVTLCRKCHLEVHKAYREGFREEYMDMLEEITHFQYKR